MLWVLSGLHSTGEIEGPFHRRLTEHQTRFDFAFWEYCLQSRPAQNKLPCVWPFLIQHKGSHTPTLESFFKSLSYFFRRSTYSSSLWDKIQPNPDCWQLCIPPTTTSYFRMPLELGDQFQGRTESSILIKSLKFHIWQFARRCYFNMDARGPNTSNFSSSNPAYLPHTTCPVGG